MIGCLHTITIFALINVLKSLHACTFFMILSSDFFEHLPFQKIFQEYTELVKQFFRPDLGSNCLQRLTALGAKELNT